MGQLGTGLGAGHEAGAGLDWGSSVPGMGMKGEQGWKAEGSSTSELALEGEVAFTGDQVGMGTELCWTGVGAGDGERTRVGEDRAGGLEGLDAVA